VTYTSIFGDQGQESPATTGGYQSVFANEPAAAPGYKSVFADDPTAAKKEDDGGFFIPTPWGIAGAAIKEGKAMVEGVSHLIGAGVHDIAQGVKDILPGEQAGEAGGYKLDDIAMALPGALAKDYGSRYGITKFLQGDFWGGLSDLEHGIYEHPLSFAGDVLMVGAGVKAAAKAGILGEAAGASVLGHAAGETAELGGVSLTTGKPLALTLSENPVARLVQNKVYKLGQYEGTFSKTLGRFGSPTESYVSGLPDIGKLNTAQAGVALSEATGLPLWRPVVSKAIEARGTSKLLSIAGIEIKDAWIPEARQVSDYVARMRERLGKPVGGDIGKYGAEDDLLGKLEGLDGTLDAPSSTAAVGWSPDPALEAQVGDVILPASDVEGTVRPLLANAYGKKYGEEGGYQWVDKTGTTPIRSPHNMAGENKSQAIFYTADMNDAPIMARDIAKRMDGDIVWVKNYVKEPGSYDGYHVGIRTKGADGADVITDVSIATRELAAEQKMWGTLAVRAETTSKEVDALVARATAEGVDADLAKSLFDKTDELEATKALTNDTFSYTRRTLNNGGDYDALLTAADQIRPVAFNASARIELTRGNLTSRIIMDRAFGPIRLQKYSTMMRTMQADVQRILDDAVASGAKGEDIIPTMYAALERGLGGGHPAVEGIFRSKVDEGIPFLTEDNLSGVLATGEKTILGDNSWLPRGWELDTAGAARKITDAVRLRTHDQFVKFGESPGFTWHELVGEQGDLPMPQYYPHIKSSRHSAEAINFGNRGTRVIESAGNREKAWGGWLRERGLIERDPVRVYSNLFREIARHDEFAGMMDTLATKYGRVISEEELQMRSSGALGAGAEVLITKRGLTEFISAKQKLMTLTHESVMGGDDFAQATVKAIQTLMDDALEHFRAGGTPEEVFAIPTHIAKHIDRAAKLSFGKTFNFYYDSAMGLWKSSVLALSPRWVMNNTLGNLAYMSVAAPQAIRYAIGQMMPRNRALVKSMLGEKFSGQLERDFMHGEFGAGEQRLAMRAQDANVGWAEQQAAWQARGGESFLGARTTGAISKTRTFATKVRTLNSRIEDASRRGVALESLRKQAMLGWGSRFLTSKQLLVKVAKDGFDDPQMWARTVKDVNNVLGDYLVMSPLEQQIIRRYAMPFYAFYRHTAKFVVKMPFQHPLKSQLLQRITEIDRQMEGSLPEYMRGAAEIMPGQWLNFNRANPLAAVTEGYLPALTHPLLSLAVQRLTGTNPFGQPYEPKPTDHVVTSANGTQYAIKYGPNGEYQGVQAITGQWQPPLWQAVGSMVPQFALLPGVDIFGRDFARKAAGLVGVPYTGFDAQKYAEYQQRSALEAYGRGASAYARYG
jgi:hypothetical protein